MVWLRLDSKLEPDGGGLDVLSRMVGELSERWGRFTRMAWERNERKREQVAREP